MPEAVLSADSSYGPAYPLIKYYVAMKLFILILILSFNVSASVYSQKINLTFKDAPLREVLQSIRKQSGYNFLFKSSMLNQAKPVTINLNQADIDQTLQSIFADQPFNYQIENKIITLKRKADKTPSLLDKVKAMFRFLNIQGKVTNELGQPIAGVNVSVKNGKARAVTSSSGNYTVDADANDALVFSFIGFVTTEVNIQNQNRINVVLKESLGQLDQVQVIGYGTTTKRLNTGNVSSIKADVIAQQPVTNVLQAVQGRIAGLQIVQTNGLPGSPMTVRIRGRNSINANNDPLYVVDGVPFTSTGDGVNGPQGVSSPMNLINPHNIESIEVLKDADATAIYGSRAANGVILITTKQGKAGKTAIDVNVNYGLGEVTRMPRSLTTAEYLQIRKDAFANSGITPNATNAFDLVKYDPNANFDWQDLLIGGTAKNTDATAAISGGTTQTNFLLSGTYHHETTVRKLGDDYSRGNVHLSVNHKSENGRFYLRSNIFYTSDKTNENYDIQGFLSSVNNSIPNYPIYDAGGKFNWTDNQRNYIASYTGFYKNSGSNMNGNFYSGYHILPGLDVKNSFGYNRISSSNIIATPSTALNPSTGAKPNSSFVERAIESYVIEPQITYIRKIAKAKLELLLGGTIQRNNTKSKAISVSNYTSDLLLENPGFGTPFVSGTNTLYKYTSIFGRINYNWDNRYIINANFRRDGSSRFGPGKQFGNFASAGAAWLFSDEKMFKDNLQWLSYGKLRGSYGTTGSDGIGDYAYLSYYNVGQNYGAETSIYPAQIGNANYQWEVNRKLEIGLELGFLKDHILLNTSFYRNRSGNQLVQTALPALTGFTGYTGNLPAQVENRGWEFEVSSINIENKNIKWSSSFNLTLPKNRLLSFPDLDKSTYASTYVIGQPLSIIQGFSFLGVDPQTGLAMVKDVNGNGNMDYDSSYNNKTGDYVNIGNTDPKWYAGFSNSISYQSFQLDVFFQYIKQLGYNRFSQNASLFGNTYNTGSLYLGYWKSPGDPSNIPKPLAQFNNSTTNFQLSSAGISDASFLRLKNVSLSYVLPAHYTNKIGINKVKLFVQGQNLWTVTPFKGYDPENAVSAALQIPPLKMLVVGIQCSL